MEYILGIDVGGTTTKIVGFSDSKMIGAAKVQATDPLASLYGAFGKFSAEYSITLDEIKRVMVTGVGSSYVKNKIFGIPTGCTAEFDAIGLGGLYLSGLKSAIVCSVGTGTAFVDASLEGACHMGGTGVGGGTLLGLSGLIMNIHSFDNLIEMAKDGNLANIDLKIGEMARSIDSTLDLTMTASNFGKVSDIASKSDISLGIINLLCETVGMMAVFAVRGNEPRRPVVLTGTLMTQPLMQKRFMDLTKMLEVEFVIPENAEYATAVGASLVHSLGWDYTEVLGEQL